MASNPNQAFKDRHLTGNGMDDAKATKDQLTAIKSKVIKLNADGIHPAFTTACQKLFGKPKQLTNLTYIEAAKIIVFLSEWEEGE